MKWIGFDRNDPDQNTFEFEDTAVLATNPPQYSVRFTGSGVTGSIECSRVFKLKPVKPVKRTVKPAQARPEVVTEQNGGTVTVEVPEPPKYGDDDLQRAIEDELRPKWSNREEPVVERKPVPVVVQEEQPVKKTARKKKEKADKSAPEPVQETSVNGVAEPHKYEYRTVIGEIDDNGSVEERLNALGDDGWEMVGFEILQSVFPNRSRMFCILKRNKR